MLSTSSSVSPSPPVASNPPMRRRLLSPGMAWWGEVIMYAANHETKAKDLTIICFTRVVQPPTSDAGWLTDFEGGCIKNINDPFRWLPWFWGRARLPCGVGFLKISLPCLTYKKLLAGAIAFPIWRACSSRIGCLIKSRQHQRPAVLSSRKKTMSSPSLAAFFATTLLDSLDDCLNSFRSEIYLERNSRLWFANPFWGKKTECTMRTAWATKKTPCFSLYWLFHC